MYVNDDLKSISLMRGPRRVDASWTRQRPCLARRSTSSSEGEPQDGHEHSGHRRCSGTCGTLSVSSDPPSIPVVTLNPREP